jgi:hypothetical protein
MSGTSSRKGGYPLGLHPGAVLLWAFIVASFILAREPQRTQEANTWKAQKAATTAVDVPAHASNLLYFRPLDVNTASMEELTLLPGVGEVTASRIVRFRQEQGFLLTTEELGAMNGPVYPRLLGAIAPYLATGP